MNCKERSKKKRKVLSTATKAVENACPSLVLGHTWRVCQIWRLSKKSPTESSVYGHQLTSGLNFAPHATEREAMDTVFATKQPDAFLQVQRPPFTYPAVPPGTGPIAFRLGKRPRRSYFIVAQPTHQTFYRKLPNETAWHFCRNCEKWPHAGFEERDNYNPPHEFCHDCIKKHRDERCEWANIELSSARSYRRAGDY